MSFSVRNLETALLERPAPPAPFRAQSGVSVRRVSEYRSLVPPPPWIMRHDPFLVLLLMESPFLAAAVLNWIF